MDWKQERDLLIAQTMAFVQSVTGKRPDAELLTAGQPNAVPSKASPLVGAPLAAAPLAAAPLAAAPLAAAPLATAPSKVTVQASPEAPVLAPSPMPVPTVIEVPPAPAAAVVDASAPEQLPHFVTLDIRGDFQSEVRARVANFRANQQRFLKEREDYCSSTMAKVRAAIRDNSELPRSGK